VQTQERMHRVEEVLNFFFSVKEKAVATRQEHRIKSIDDGRTSIQDVGNRLLRLSNHTQRSQHRTIAANSLLAGWLFDINKNKLSFRQWLVASTMPILEDREWCKRGSREWLEFPRTIAC